MEKSCANKEKVLIKIATCHITGYYSLIAGKMKGDPEKEVISATKENAAVNGITVMCLNDTCSIPHLVKVWVNHFCKKYPFSAQYFVISSLF